MASRWGLDEVLYHRHFWPMRFWLGVAVGMVFAGNAVVADLMLLTDVDYLLPAVVLTVVTALIAWDLRHEWRKPRWGDDASEPANNPPDV